MITSLMVTPKDSVDTIYELWGICNEWRYSIERDLLNKNGRLFFIGCHDITEVYELDSKQVDFIVESKDDKCFGAKNATIKVVQTPSGGSFDEGMIILSFLEKDICDFDKLKKEILAKNK